jgi:polyphosphate glucokinase
MVQKPTSATAETSGDHLAPSRSVLGIDIGGTGMKGALVDPETGMLTSERYRVPTPHPAVPAAVGQVVADLVRHFSWKGSVGCTFPGVVKDGVVHSAANVDPSWIGTDAQLLFHRIAGCPVVLLNDAGAAGVAEMAFGAGKGQRGTVIMVTLGTGIGTAVFFNGILLPNTELGHIEIRGKDAEERASDRARIANDWKWSKWAKHVDEYLGRLEALFSPDLFILGGGVSQKSEHFLPLLHRKARIVPAQLLNEAGIVGAALTAAQRLTVVSIMPRG